MSTRVTEQRRRELRLVVPLTPEPSYEELLELAARRRQRRRERRGLRPEVFVALFVVLFSAALVGAVTIAYVVLTVLGQVIEP